MLKRENVITRGGNSNTSTCMSLVEIGAFEPGAGLKSPNARAEEALISPVQGRVIAYLSAARLETLSLTVERKSVSPVAAS